MHGSNVTSEVAFLPAIQKSVPPSVTKRAFRVQRFGAVQHQALGTRQCNPSWIARRSTEETNMPVILLWVGLPILLLGGGYFVIQSMN